MATLNRSDLERWSGFAQDGLREMKAWVAANAASPFAAPLQQIITATEQQVATLQVIIKKLIRAELLARKAVLQAEIDAITQEVGQ